MKNLGKTKLHPNRQKADLAFLVRRKEALSRISQEIMLKTRKKPVIFVTIGKYRTWLQGYGIDEKDLPHPAIPKEIQPAVEKMLKTIKPGQCVVIIRRMDSNIGSAYQAWVTEVY